MLKNKKLLKEFSTEQIKVYSVDGDFIRKNNDACFISGNWLTHDYISNKEIWIDEKLNKTEQKLAVLKNYAMIIPLSKGISYEDAVLGYANVVEDKLKNSKLIDTLLEKMKEKTDSALITEVSEYNGHIHIKHNPYNNIHHAHHAKMRDFSDNDQIVKSR